MVGIGGAGLRRGFRREVLRHSPGLRRRERQMLLSSILLLVIFVPLLGAITYFACWLLFTGWAPQGQEPDPPLQRLLMAAGAGTVTLLLIAAPVMGWVSVAREWRDRRRIAESADRTGWHYQAEAPLEYYTTLLFRVGNRGRIENSLHWHGERFVEVANYSYSTSTLENPRTEVGFVRMELTRRLPHMYLQSRTWTGKPNAIRIPFGKKQRLSLEGDFDKWFHLYCPEEYERDALYVFTPDLMAMLIDHAAGFDVEVKHNWIYFYGRGKFDMADPAITDFAMGLDSTLGRGTERQSSRYRDERSADPAYVGEQGARLRWSRARVLAATAATSLAGWAVVAAVLFLTGRLGFAL